MILSTTLNNGYNIQDGTSFSAPIVSGIAALMLSVNPNLTQQQVYEIITRTASNFSRNNQTGYGLVNAYEAVRQSRFGIDFTFTNNSSFDIAGLYVGLAGKMGNTYTSFINCDPNWVPPGSSTGLPYYPGSDIVAVPGTPISNLVLDLYASTYSTSFHPEDVIISAWVEGGATQDDIATLDLDGVSSVTIPLTHSSSVSVPSNGRLMLHINVFDYYSWSPAPAPDEILPATDSLPVTPAR
jgi:hypothetical protein